MLTLVGEHTDERPLGVLGDPGVNVVTLNLRSLRTTRAVSRGRLRIYLGAAPGVGKTFAMLDEGRRRAERGTDVVVALVETHGRPNTAALLDGLEVVPRRTVSYRGATLEELDLAAVLARAPQVALVDELAHTNVGDAGNPKRWQDVHALLDAGIDVVTTVNVQHLESLNDVVETITGIRQRETVPDGVVRGADQVELVDMAPEALRRRMAHGNVYAPEKVDAALANYFRVGNLSALRELALLWVADEVDEAVRRYRTDHDIDAAWETRERVVVAVTGAPSGEGPIRRAARMAQRAHGDLIGVHVRAGDGLSDAGGVLADRRRLVEDLGGEFHEVVDADVARGLATFARSVQATQLVLGATDRSRWAELVHGSVINQAIRRSGGIDVHVISTVVGEERASLPAAPGARSALSERRRRLGWALAVALPLLATIALLPLRGDIDLSTVLLLHLVAVCITAAVGGPGAATAAAVVATAAVNWTFTEPYRTLAIDDAEQVVALVVFVAVGVLVGALVGLAARRSATAERARAEAEALAIAGAGLAAEADPLAAVLGHVRVTFGQATAALVAAGDRVEAIDGDPLPGPAEQHEADRIEVTDDLVLQLVPGGLSAEDRRLLGVFAGRLADAVEHRGLRLLAAEATARTRADELRTAILRAVSHDLRSPLASIKASASSLLQHDVVWSDTDRDEFARTIDEEVDRLDRLVGNLLDMSRIEAGAVRATTVPVGLDDVVAAALDSLSEPSEHVTVDIAPDLPAAIADPGLLERVLANVLANALRHRPEGTAVRVQTAANASEVVLRIADQGPGVPVDQREQVFEPFQRLGDGGGGGVGLGLAVARGFTAAMGAAG